MASTTFTPYWRQFGTPRNPYSFVFFVVAQIDGRHRPIAVVSSRGPAEPADTEGIGSLQGFPLIATCNRVITIFSEKANRTAIKAELSLAAAYFMRDGGKEEYRPGQVELEENDASDRDPRLETEHWDHVSVREFPFITACLLQGVAFNPEGGFCYQATPQSLDTVYRDTSIEYGMVVIDITELNAVRYGIVGFAAMPMKWVPSIEALHQQIGPQNFLGAPSNSGGELRVLNRARSRNVTSAAEYLTKFLGTNGIPKGEQITKLIFQIPLVHSDALEVVWPAGSKLDIALPMVNLSIGADKSLHEQAIRSVLQSTIDINSFEISIFDEVRNLPNFKKILQRNLLQHSKRLGNTQSAGLLLRLAFENEEHLGLERLDDLSVEAISAAVNVPELGVITSISLCISTIRNLSSDLIEGLSRSANLREVYFLQSPFRKSDTPDIELLEALAARPDFFSRVKVMFAGSYSAALRKVFWLPSIPEKIRKSTIRVQAAPLSKFPIQQILTSHRVSTHNTEYRTASLYLGDALLTPERFAAGFLTYLRDSTYPDRTIFNSSARLFSFSSAPASLSESTLTSAEISHIPAESFVIGDDKLPDDISPKFRDLSPDGWTVLITSGRHWNPKASKEEVIKYWYCIRYALVRPRKHNIEVENPPSRRLSQDELEVVGLKEFLKITAPDIDLELVDFRLQEVAEHLVSVNELYGQGVWPEGLKPVDILAHEEAADMLLGCLKDARGMNERVRNAMEMEEDLGVLGQPWYPELLLEKS